MQKTKHIKIVVYNALYFEKHNLMTTSYCGKKFMILFDGYPSVLDYSDKF